MAARGERPTRDKLIREAAVKEHPAQLAIAKFTAIEATKTNHKTVAVETLAGAV
jgi:hypothetical protein